MSDEEKLEPRRSGRDRLELRVIGEGEVHEPQEPEVLPVEESDQAEDAEEEVIRLEVPAEPERMDLPEARMEPEEVEPEQAPSTEGQQGNPGNNRWMIWMGLAIASLVVLAVTLVTIVQDGGNPPAESVNPQVKTDEARVPKEETPLERAVSLAGDYMLEVQAFLEVYTKLDSYEQAVPMIRDGESIKPLLKDQWQPLRLPDRFFSKPGVEVNERRGTVWMSVTGIDINSQRVRLVFVVDHEGELVFDWAASVGAGEVPFGELKSLPEGREVTMRVLVSPHDMYTSIYPETVHQCYILEDASQKQFVWGYVRRDSEENETLLRMLNLDSFLFARQSKTSVTVRLKAGAGSSVGQFLLTEVVQGNWIKPAVDP